MPVNYDDNIAWTGCYSIASSHAPVLQHGHTNGAAALSRSCRYNSQCCRSPARHVLRESSLLQIKMMMDDDVVLSLSCRHNSQCCRGPAWHVLPVAPRTVLHDGHKDGVALEALEEALGPMVGLLCCAWYAVHGVLCVVCCTMATRMVWHWRP